MRRELRARTSERASAVMWLANTKAPMPAHIRGEDGTANLAAFSFPEAVREMRDAGLLAGPINGVLALQGVVWENIDFSGADMRQTHLTDVQMKNCNFAGADIRDVLWKNVSVDSSDFHDARFDDSQIVVERSGANPPNQWRAVDFTASSWTNTSVSRTAFADCTFALATCREVAFRNCSFAGCVFEGTLEAQFDSRLNPQGDGWPLARSRDFALTFDATSFAAADISWSQFVGCTLGEVDWPRDQDVLLVSHERLVLEFLDQHVAGMQPELQRRLRVFAGVGVTRFESADSTLIWPLHARDVDGANSLIPLIRELARASAALGRGWTVTGPHAEAIIAAVALDD